MSESQGGRSFPGVTQATEYWAGRSWGNHLPHLIARKQHNATARGGQYGMEKAAGSWVQILPLLFTIAAYSEPVPEPSELHFHVFWKVLGMNLGSSQNPALSN